MSSQEQDEIDIRIHCKKSLRRMSTGSSIIINGKSILDDDSQRISARELEQGPKLGQGAFSDVREVRRLSTDAHSIISQEPGQEEEHSIGSYSSGRKLIQGALKYSRQESIEEDSIFLHRRLPQTAHSEITSGSQGGSTVFHEDTDAVSRSYYYAMKKLRPDLSKSRAKSGAIDLAVEAQFLASLSHRNIVQLGGIGDDPGSKDFFLMVERLETTLSSEITLWKREQQTINANRLNDSRSRIQDSLQNHLLNRMKHAHDLASAMSYLHEKRMIFRDLKPDNVGFTHDHIIKLFDFGLARELKPERRMGRDQFFLSRAGSPRYMAPEVMRSKPYGLPADVFSLSILLYEMSHLKKPFRRLNAKEHEKAILTWRRRPKLSKQIPKDLKKLMKKCWKHDAKERPDMSDCYRALGSFLESNQISIEKRLKDK